MDLERDTWPARPAGKPSAPATERAPGELHEVLAELSRVQEELHTRTDELCAARTALETERERYADLFDAAPFAYLVTTLDGKIEAANPAAAELLNVRDPGLVGSRLAAYVVDRRDLRTHLMRFATGVLEADRWELALQPRQSAVVHVDAAVRLGGLGGDSLRWRFLDVEGRVQGEREAEAGRTELELRIRERTYELEEDRARLEAIVDQMPAGLLIVDVRRGELELWNGEAARIFGVASLDLATIDGRVANGTWPLERVVTTGRTMSDRVELVRDDNTRALVEVTAAPVRARDGRMIAAVAVLQDVTVRERREHAEREFVTNAAHELQTPLTAILSAVEVLQAGAKDVPADRDRFLEHVQAETERLSRLAHALLVLARVQTGAEEPARERVPLRQLLDDVALGLRPARGIEVRVRCAARLAALADPALLEQAVINLASNAAKHTASGAILLTARPLDEERVAIEVADTGSGVPAGEEEHVFARFYKLGGPDRSGFGLGLAIARDAVEALGGSVQLRRRHDRGTVARIIVPRAKGRQ